VGTIREGSEVVPHVKEFRGGLSVVAEYLVDSETGEPLVDSETDDNLIDSEA